jgi:hypothetical protein
VAVRKTAKGAALKRWFKEKWTDEKGNVCGSSKNKKTKKCRPSKKVSSKTPVTWKGKELVWVEELVQLKKENKMATTKKFKVHKMYKGSKAVTAKTMKDHLRLKKLGYGHTKPKTKK